MHHLLALFQARPQIWATRSTMANFHQQSLIALLHVVRTHSYSLVLSKVELCMDYLGIF